MPGRRLRAAKFCVANSSPCFCRCANVPTEYISAVSLVRTQTRIFLDFSTPDNTAQGPHFLAVYALLARIDWGCEIDVSPRLLALGCMDARTKDGRFSTAVQGDRSYAERLQVLFLILQSSSPTFKRKNGVSNPISIGASYRVTGPYSSSSVYLPRWAPGLC